MSKIILIAIIIGVIIIGSTVTVFLTSEQPTKLNDKSETSIPEIVVPKGKDIQINLEDGLAMTTVP